MKRRKFIQNASLLSGAVLARSILPHRARAASSNSLHISTNQYSWTVFYRREDKKFNEINHTVFPKFSGIGLSGFEPTIGSAKDIERLAPLLQDNGIEMRSVYVGTSLHEPDLAKQSIQKIMSFAEQARKAGVKIVVTNPNPIKWGGKHYKNDEQLRTQSDALNKLGNQLADHGLILAYHNHDIEMRQSAREFHHMMVGTDPDSVTLCLDANWIYRGAGNSSVALFDILNLYGERVSELHLRQSHNGVWTETFKEGDINYPKIADYFDKHNMNPHLVLEIAVEKGTPHTMKPIQAHEISCDYVNDVFG